MKIAVSRTDGFLFLKMVLYNQPWQKACTTLNKEFHEKQKAASRCACQEPALPMTSCTCCSLLGFHSCMWWHIQHNDSTNRHLTTKQWSVRPRAPPPAPHPVCVLFEYGLLDVACKQRRGKVAQVHHLIYHAILVWLPKYHVLLLLIRVAAVGLGAVAPCSGTLSEHVEAFLSGDSSGGRWWTQKWENSGRKKKQSFFYHCKVCWW